MTRPSQTSSRSTSRHVGPFLLAAVLLPLHAGCTSAIGTALLRDVDWSGSDHAAEPEPATSDDEPTAGESFDSAADTPPTTTVTDADDDPAAVRRAAVEQAAERLSRLETLDEATQATLVGILKGTPQEDWPAVIDEFTASLAATGALDRLQSATAPPPAVAPEAHAVPAAETAAAGESVAVEPPAAAVSEQPPEAASPEPTPPEPAAVAAQPVAAPALAIRNACFASRVQAWGVVERFAGDRFRSGQDVIVYFELDNLSAAESPAGHTTCIDTVLRLVDHADRTVHTWTFEPVAETCPSRRRDYFARYVVRIPESAVAGDHRITLAVTDTRADETVTATLPLQIAAE
jgi:hypothetical protein